MSFRRIGFRIAISAAAVVSPVWVQAQCPPLANSMKSQAKSSPEFSDEPTFTIAGVTDSTNLGGHASSTAIPPQAVAKDVDSLKQQSGSMQPATEENSAEKALREALQDKQYPRARDIASKLVGAHETAELRHTLADIEEKLGDSLAAVRDYQRAAELQPSENNIFDWGAELLAHDAIEPAVQVFGKGNRLFPKSTRMLVALGAASYAKGSYEQAGRCLCEAADLNPREPSPYSLLSKLQKVDSAQSEAINDRLERFQTLVPENALANFYYALGLWNRRGSATESQALLQVEGLLRKAISIDPTFAPAHFQLGILYEDRKKLSEAIEAYQKAIVIDPNFQAAHYRLAQVYRANREAAKANSELTIYKQLAGSNGVEADRNRHEMQQFVYTLRKSNTK